MAKIHGAGGTRTWSFRVPVSEDPPPSPQAPSIGARPVELTDLFRVAMLHRVWLVNEVFCIVLRWDRFKQARVLIVVEDVVN